jgi:DNA-binding NtrC family response regulator
MLWTARARQVTGVNRYYRLVDVTVCEADPMNHGAPEALSPGDLSGLHILLVEDTWHVGEAIKDVLQFMGAEVVGPVATAAEAESLLSERVPDAALVDFCLRDDEFADVLIGRLNERGVHVVVTSGYEVLPTPAVKAAAFLKKPFTNTQLLASLQPLVARRRVEQRNTSTTL